MNLEDNPEVEALLEGALGRLVKVEQLMQMPSEEFITNFVAVLWNTWDKLDKNRLLKTLESEKK